MLAEFNAFLHRVFHRFNRSEWAIRHFGLSVEEGKGEEPGLLLIQIDGFSRRQLEKALIEGRMPYLRKLREELGYDIRTFYPGLPSTTPAVQGELFYGVRAIVPAFSFRHKGRGEIGSMFNSEWAAEMEEKMAAQAPGLLKGGSSWSNIYTGGAGKEESHFCIASLGLGREWLSWRTFLSVGVFLILQIAAVVRLLALMILELGIALGDALAGIFTGRSVSMELGMALSQMCVGIGMREIIRVGAKVDVTRGLPIVHVNFVGYDEPSHRRGPDSAFAHWALRGIDWAISDIAREALRSKRRDYQIWIFSDHGQEHTRSFAEEFPGGLEGAVAACMDLPSVTGGGADARRVLTRPYSRRWWRRVGQRIQASRALPDEEQMPFELAAMGPVGHLYFKSPRTDGENVVLAQRLVVEGRVPGVLHHDSAGVVTWFHAQGSTCVPEEVPTLLDRHPEYLREEIARDLVGLCAQEHAGDLVLLGWAPGGISWTFVAEHGSHAGLGEEETQGFLMVPPQVDLPEAPYVRPGTLREIVLSELGRSARYRNRIRPERSARELSVMTYNVHSCVGLDGRVSPRRIARILAHQSPDLIALQEVDVGKSRSRSEDQLRLIADSLGCHALFCPTVVRGGERYGHAILSRYPVEKIKEGQLPTEGASWWPEARGALWVRVEIDGQPIHFVTTHLGLSGRERLAQIEALMGPEWLGPVLENEPVILAGDFNFTPGSRAHRLALSTGQLFDTARGIPLATFSSRQPFLRLDHIFLTRHFQVRDVRAVRNDATHLASDHLPLMADLIFSPTGEFPH